MPVLQMTSAVNTAFRIGDKETLIIGGVKFVVYSMVRDDFLHLCLIGGIDLIFQVWIDDNHGQYH